MHNTLNRKIEITNALSEKTYKVVPLHEIEPSAKHLENIQSICNEPLVYKWCFQELCNSEPYPQELASDWLSWAKSGWNEDTHYVYVVLEENGTITAACDIKSSNRERAEIGYWCSSNHRGIMTNAALAIIDLAREAGFRCLFADIHPDNHRSLAVIKRCGFSKADRKPTTEGHIPHDLVLSLK